MRGRKAGRRGRKKAAPIEDPTQRTIQIPLDFEAAGHMGFEAGDLQMRIDNLEGDKLRIGKALRELKKEQRAILVQLGAKAKNATVEVEERPDFEAGVVVTHRKDTGEIISDREMTSQERAAGVVHTPAEAAHSLHEVAKRAEGGNGAVHEEDTFEEAEAPAISTDPADVAAVHEVTR